MLIRERFSVSGRSCAQNPVTPCNAKTNGLEFWVAWTAGGVMSHLHVPNDSATMSVHHLTSRHEKDVAFEVLSRTSSQSILQEDEK